MPGTISDPLTGQWGIEHGRAGQRRLSDVCHWRRDAGCATAPASRPVASGDRQDTPKEHADLDAAVGHLLDGAEHFLAAQRPTEPPSPKLAYAAALLRRDPMRAGRL